MAGRFAFAKGFRACEMALAPRLRSEPLLGRCRGNVMDSTCPVIFPVSFHLTLRQCRESHMTSPGFPSAQNLTININELSGKRRKLCRDAPFRPRIAEPAEGRVSDVHAKLCTQNGKDDRGLLRPRPMRPGRANRGHEIFESFCCTPPRGCVEFWDFAGDTASNQQITSTIKLYSWGLHCCSTA